jgi:hypothetical protein
MVSSTPREILVVRSRSARVQTLLNTCVRGKQRRIKIFVAIECDNPSAASLDLRPQSLFLPRFELGQQRTFKPGQPAMQRSHPPIFLSFRPLLFISVAISASAKGEAPYKLIQFFGGDVPAVPVEYQHFE